MWFSPGVTAVGHSPVDGLVVVEFTAVQGPDFPPLAGLGELHPGGFGERRGWGAGGEGPALILMEPGWPSASGLGRCLLFTQGGVARMAFQGPQRR